MKKILAFAGAVLLVLFVFNLVFTVETNGQGNPYFWTLKIRTAIINSGYETIADSLRVGNSATFNGTVAINSTSTFGGVTDFTAVLADTNAFTTTATADTVLISGALGTDKYLVANRGATIDSGDVLTAHALADTLIVSRNAGGISGRKYTWFRFR